MAYPILFRTDVEPYRTIIPRIGDGCEINMWLQDEFPADVDTSAIEAIYAYSHDHITGSMMAQLPNLKVISCYAVGVDHIDLEGAKRLGIPVGHTPGVLDDTTADMTFALLMAAARNVVQGDRYARGPEYIRFDCKVLVGQDVSGQTLGIVGLGRIGFQVARRAAGFDMPIIYHNRTPNEKAEKELGATYVSLEELLSTADFVTLNMPLTDETRKMIGKKQLALMKPTATLVNIGRGGTVDHEALLETMRDRRIHAAGLDVTDPEPLPRDHGLNSLDNVIIMPHLGSGSEQTRDAMAKMAAANLMAGLEGRELPHRIC